MHHETTRFSHCIGRTSLAVPAERAVWDGAQVLHELRPPGSDTTSAFAMEGDGTRTDLSSEGMAMTRRAWIRWTVALGVTAAIGLLTLLRPRLTVEEVEAQLQGWVTPGATITEVAAKLDSLGIERSPLTPERTELLAIWRRTRISLIEEASIQARFLFDKRGVLSRYEVKELWTSM